MTQNTFIQDLLAAAQKAGIGQAEVYFQQAESMRVFAYEGAVSDYTVHTTDGLSLRGLVNGKMGTAYTEALDDAATQMLVNSVLESAALINDEDEQFIFAGSQAYEMVDCSGDPGTPEERIDFALEVERIARSLDPRVKQLGDFTGLDTIRETVRIVNTNGLDLTHTADMCVGFADAIAREGERAATNFSYQTGYSLSALDAGQIAHDAVEEAVSQLEASPCDSGVMPVIIRNTAMANLLSAFEGVFSADAAQKDLSLLKGKEGETIAAACVVLLDDPLLSGGLATRAFDAEGVATRAKRVIENGVLTTLLHNLKTAKKAGCESTGNAARSGYSGGVGIAPSNFYLQPGDLDLAALSAQMGDGLVVTAFEGLHAGANAVSGDFSLLVKGYLVEGGKKGRAIEQVTAAGNFFQLLKDIAAVGSDLKFLVEPFGSPSVLVRQMSVAGK